MGARESLIPQWSHTCEGVGKFFLCSVCKRRSRFLPTAILGRRCPRKRHCTFGLFGALVLWVKPARPVPHRRRKRPETRAAVSPKAPKDQRNQRGRAGKQAAPFRPVPLSDFVAPYWPMIPPSASPKRDFFFFFGFWPGWFAGRGESSSLAPIMSFMSMPSRPI